MLKMKKIMITGMAFLIAMTALAGCGNVTETETTEETSAADGNHGKQRQFRWESDHTG